MHETFVSMLFTLLGEQMCVRIFCTSTTVGSYFCGSTAYIVAERGGNKGKLSTLLETMVADRITMSSFEF